MGNQAGDVLEVGLQRLRESARPEIEQRLTVIESLRHGRAGRSGPERPVAGGAERGAPVGWLALDPRLRRSREAARRLNGLLESQQRPSEAGRAAALLASLRYELRRQPAPVSASSPAGTHGVLRARTHDALRVGTHGVLRVGTHGALRAAATRAARAGAAGR